MHNTYHPMNNRILQTSIFLGILQLCITSNSTLLVDCSLETTDSKVHNVIQTFISAQKELIFLHFQLPDYKDIHSENGTIYKILDLVWTRGGRGDKLLLMHPNFEQFSVGTLMFGVEHVNIPLRQISSHCIMNTTENEFEDQIIRFALNKLNIITNQDNNIRLCNMHVKNEDGDAIFFYSCCFMNASEDIICSKLETNGWMDVLFFAMGVTYVLAFLFTPLVIPTSWYKTTVDHIYSLLLDEYYLKVSHPPENENSNQSYVQENETPSGSDIRDNEMQGAENKMSDSQEKEKKLPVCTLHETMKGFLEKVNTLSPGNSLILKVKEIQIDTEKLSIVTPNHVPVGIFHFVYKQFIKCEVKRHKHVKTCCEDEISVCPGLKRRWDTILKPFTQALFFIFLFCPWFARIIFFYAVEESDRTKREYFASRRNLNNPNVLKWNVTYSLKPNHALFIVCYIAVAFLPLYKLIIKVFVEVSSDLRRTLTSTSTDIMQTFMLPCKHFGILGICISPLYWTIFFPVIFIVYILTSIPLITILITAVGAFTYGIYKGTKECWKETKVGAIFLFPILLVAGIVSIMPILSSMIICLEVVIFFLQILLYLFIGIIINSSLVLTYVAFGGMLLFYAYDSVRRVKSKYEIFCQKVIDYFISNVKNAIKTIIKEKNHCCFLIKVNEHDERLTFKFENKTKSGKLCLLTELPLLFFDNGVPFMSESLYFKMCEIKYVAAPGSVWKSYTKAFQNLFVIFVFLMFVAVIVLAFGQTTGIPSTYQAIATLGGGLIPLFVRLYLSDKPLDFEKDHILFQAELKRILKQTEWDICDIDAELSDTDEKCDVIMVNIPKTESKSTKKSV